MEATNLHNEWVQRNATIEIPLVCLGCGEVHRVASERLAEPTVLCPTCGLERESAPLVATLPRTLRPRTGRLLAVRP